MEKTNYLFCKVTRTKVIREVFHCPANFNCEECPTIKRKQKQPIDPKKGFTVTLFSKPGRFPKTIADLLTLAILSGNENEITAFLRNPEARTTENMNLLADWILGKIKKTRGPKQRQGFSDLLIWTRYKALCSQGGNPKKAMKETVRLLEEASRLPKGDLWFQAANRRWEQKNIRRNVKEIITELDNYFGTKPQKTVP